MEILGYSERGVVNSLLYEIKFSPNNLQLLSNLLSLVYFPDRTVKFQISAAKILIEQSFSDFGNADTVLLVENLNGRQVIFIEAKVKTFRRQTWAIENEFKELKAGIQKNKISSSNLFIQLYHKARLIKTLQMNDGINQLQNGVQFPRCSSKMQRKIGKNKVVMTATNQLKDYCNDALFICLVPYSISSLKNFYKEAFYNYNPDGFQEWNISNWGFLSWSEVEEFCKRSSLEMTLEMFKWNKGQIY